MKTESAATPYAVYRDLGRMDYAEALAVQRREFERLLQRKGAADADAGTIFTVEHPAVYTLGKNGAAANLLVSEELLRSSGAALCRTDRGGDITFHGEGQIVGYPVLDLERTGFGLRDYVERIEQAVIETLAGYGIAAGRSSGASGVWLGEGAEMAVPQTPMAEMAVPQATMAEMAVTQTTMAGTTGPLRKICAIGVRASRYVAMHGFALNVTTDLSRFALINPCGFTDRGVTSVEKELGYAPPAGEIALKTVSRLAQLLGLELRV